MGEVEKLCSHKGLHKLYAEDSARGVPPDSEDKLRKMLAFLDDMQEPEELRALATWKAHTADLAIARALGALVSPATAA